MSEIYYNTITIHFVIFISPFSFCFAVLLFRHFINICVSRAFYLQCMYILSLLRLFNMLLSFLIFSFPPSYGSWSAELCDINTYLNHPVIVIDDSWTHCSKFLLLRFSSRILFKNKNKNTQCLIEKAPFDVDRIITNISSLLSPYSLSLILTRIRTDKRKQIQRYPHSLFTLVCKLFISNFDTTCTQIGFEIAQGFGSF